MSNIIDRDSCDCRPDPCNTPARPPGGPGMQAWSKQCEPGPPPPPPMPPRPPMPCPYKNECCPEKEGGGISVIILLIVLFCLFGNDKGKGGGFFGDFFNKCF